MGAQNDVPCMAMSTKKAEWRSALRDIASLLVTVSKHVNFNIASHIKRGFTYVVHKGGINAADTIP